MRGVKAQARMRGAVLQQHEVVGIERRVAADVGDEEGRAVALAHAAADLAQEPRYVVVARHRPQPERGLRQRLVLAQEVQQRVRVRAEPGIGARADEAVPPAGVAHARTPA
jgi:hypothetical protein